MSKISKIREVIKEIEIIETIIKPYEYYSTDATAVLSGLNAVKDDLKDADRAYLD